VEGSSRVVVLRDGRDVAVLEGAQISQQGIIQAMAEQAPAVAEGAAR
jgi:ABC-type sugar transport system ATPase subunit